MIESILNEQKAYFKTGETKKYKNRIKALSRLEKALRKREMQIYKAFCDDFGKSSFEVFMTEVARVYKCLRDVKKNLKTWMAQELVKTPLVLRPAKSFIIREPYGSVLIIAPNNYPLALSLEPLVMSLAAGNTAVVKLAEQTDKVSDLIKEIISEAFEPHYVASLRGGKDETKEAVSLGFDKIFFTGSSKVGKEIMKSASENLTPVVLELGGKSPAIVCKDANISLSAKRIARGKLINSGQTCIAPDFVLVHKDVRDKLIDKLKENFLKAFGEQAHKNEEFTKMISSNYCIKTFDMLNNTQGKIVYGGEINIEENYVAPTIVTDVLWNDALMREEIFAPVLPIVTFENLDDEIDRLSSMDKPLALYVFSKNRKEIKKIINNISFGGGVINDTLMHFANDNLPFGGVGVSGMGKSHGYFGYEEFVHKKSVMKRPSHFQFDFMKAPYGKKHKILKIFYR